MSHQFNLSIRLGNAAMDSPEDIAAALRKVAEKVESNLYIPESDSSEVNRILDLNGNNVGNWVVRFDKDY